MTNPFNLRFEPPSCPTCRAEIIGVTVMSGRVAEDAPSIPLTHTISPCGHTITEYSYSFGTDDDGVEP